MKLTQTTIAQKQSQITQNWHIVDVKGKVLGRVTTDIAQKLQGKHKPQYSTHLDNGDSVVVINARHVRMTGRKLQQKTYDRYSGYPGGRKVQSASDVMQNKPEMVIKHAVSGMLPKNKLRDKRMARLFVYPDQNHPYEDKFK